MGARNRDAAVAASSFIVTHIVVATAQFLIVRAATKRRYRRCCPLLWRCGLLRSRRCAVVTMRSVFPGTAALVRAWNLQNAETRVVKPTENPLTLLITATLSSSRRARLTIFKSYCRVQGDKFVIRRGSSDPQTGRARRRALPVCGSDNPRR